MGLLIRDHRPDNASSVADDPGTIGWPPGDAMTYRAPGSADQLSDELLAAWNEAIEAENEQPFMPPASRFFTLDWNALDRPVATEVRWSAAAAELRHCLRPWQARALSDWGSNGRFGAQNEYAEYQVVRRGGRPKRVVFTTELREYWLCLAVHDPDLVRSTAAEILGFEPTWQDLYGVGNPRRLTEERRAGAFIQQTAGLGYTAEGRDSSPAGPVNRDHLLFMTHPINGLDDLLFIVRFGAHPFARQGSQGPERATTAEVFQANPFADAQPTSRLFCRNADPEAAAAAHGAAFDGRTVAFRDPLGVYIRPFDASCLRLRGTGEAVPDSWVRWSRGVDGMYQRLEIGPPDHDGAFLEDIDLHDGGSVTPLRGGYQLAARIEVGPLVWVSGATPVTAEEYRYVPAGSGEIRCRAAIGRRCSEINELFERFNAKDPGAARPDE